MKTPFTLQPPFSLLLLFPGHMPKTRERLCRQLCEERAIDAIRPSKQQETLPTRSLKKKRGSSSARTRLIAFASCHTLCPMSKYYKNNRMGWRSCRCGREGACCRGAASASAGRRISLAGQRRCQFVVVNHFPWTAARAGPSINAQAEEAGFILARRCVQQVDVRSRIMDQQEMLLIAVAVNDVSGQIPTG